MPPVSGLNCMSAEQPGQGKCSMFFEPSMRGPSCAILTASRTVVAAYFPYCLAALPIDGPALARSFGFMIGRNYTLVLNVRNLAHRLLVSLMRPTCLTLWSP